ncbi:MAG: transposase [Candidatus Tectomicrobia bacterium]|nr:transposase [Candidatus Tectomicrobia bacterium]
MSHAQQVHDRRYLDDYLHMINRSGLPSNVKAEVCQHVQRAVLSTVKGVIEHVLEEELTEYLGAKRYAHLPQRRAPEQTRSGFYSRTLVTQYALVADLQVPKLRRGNTEIPWHTLDRYERCWGPLLDQHVLTYCLGLSLRDLQKTMRLMLGEVLLLQATNRVLLALEGRVETFKTTRLAEPPPVVLVDRLWVKIAYPTGKITVDSRGRHRAAKRKQKRVILTALGIWPDGHWEILHWKIAGNETTEAWDAFLEELYAKGVTEETTRLVVSDGAKGIEEAVDLHLYGVPHQRCLFHKLKNLADALEFRHMPLDPTLPPTDAKRQAKQTRRSAIVAEASAIYEAEDEAERNARLAAG